MLNNRENRIKRFQTAVTHLAMAHGLEPGEHTEALVHLAGITAGVCLFDAKKAGADWTEGLGLLTQIFALTSIETIQDMDKDNKAALSEAAKTAAVEALAKIMRESKQ